jgi:hypothetical protein
MKMDKAVQPSIHSLSQLWTFDASAQHGGHPDARFGDGHYFDVHGVPR